MSPPLDPLSIRCSIIARIGAIPVPGPTKIHGTSDSGARIPPVTTPTGISVPTIRIKLTEISLLANQQAISYKRRAEVSLNSSYTLQ